MPPSRGCRLKSPQRAPRQVVQMLWGGNAHFVSERAGTTRVPPMRRPHQQRPRGIKCTGRGASPQCRCQRAGRGRCNRRHEGAPRRAGDSGTRARRPASGRASGAAAGGSRFRSAGACAVAAGARSALDGGCAQQARGSLRPQLRGEYHALRSRHLGTMRLRFLSGGPRHALTRWPKARSSCCNDAPACCKAGPPRLLLRSPQSTHGGRSATTQAGGRGRRRWARWLRPA